MAIWEDLVNAVEGKLNDSKQWVSDVIPNNLGVDQNINTDEPPMVPQDAPPDPVQELVRNVEAKLQPVADVASNAVTDVQNKTSQWYEGAKQGLNEVRQAAEQYPEMSSAEMPGGAGLTEQDRQAINYNQQAVSNLTNETIKPVAYAAGFVNPAIAAPFMVNDFIQGSKQNGIGKTIGDFTGYNTIKGAIDNPDQFKEKFINEPVTTSAELLPAALMLRGAYKGGKQVIKNNPDFVNNLVSDVESRLNNERGSIGKPQDEFDLAKTVEEKLSTNDIAREEQKTQTIENFRDSINEPILDRPVEDFLGEQPTIEPDLKSEIIDNVNKETASTVQSKLANNPVTNGFISQDIMPIISGAKQAAQSIKNFLSPASVSDHSRMVADTIREYNASRKLDYLQTEKALEQAKTYWDKKPTEQQLADAIAYQKGELNDPALKPITDALQEELTNRGKTLSEMGAINEFDQHYLPQIWKNTPKNKDILHRYQENIMRSPKGFLKHKTIPDYETGIKMGMEPQYTNPVDMALHRLRQEDLYIMGKRIKDELVGAGELKLVNAGEEIPTGWKQVNGGDNPLGPMSDAAYYARPEVAKLIENFLGKGWENQPLYKAYMATANTMNQFQLLGGFHVGFTSFDAVVSKLTLVPKLTTNAIQNVTKGKYKEAANNIVDALTHIPGPTTPFSTAIKGRSFLKDLTDRSKINDPLVQAYRAGGGQVGLGKEFTTKYATAMRKAWVNGNYVGATLRVPFAAAERLSGLILDKVVPFQKAGVFKELMSYELKRDPSLINDRAKLRSVSAKVIDTIDNRLGQVNWDNLFFDPKFKQSLFMTMRAPGWAGGTIREMGGGILDAATTISRVKQGGPALTHRMAYDIALPVASIAAGYIGQTLLTGKSPDLSKEAGSLAYKFKNGQTDQWNNPKYSSMPSYMKDIHAWRTEPLDTAINKQHPFVSMLAQIVRNKDYYGTEIYDKKADTVTKTKDIGAYALKQLEPFSVSGAIKAAENSGKTYFGSNANADAKDWMQALLPQIGVNQTPSRLTMTEAQKEARDIMANKFQAGPRTQEQSDKTQLKAQLRKDAAGQKSIPDTILNAVRNGQISKDEAREIWNERNKQPLQRYVGGAMTIDEAMDIWQKATDEEKQQIRPEIIKKMRNALDNSKTSNEQKKKVMEYYKKYLR